MREGKVTEEVAYLSAMEEQKYAVAQADTPIDASGHLVGDLIVCRHAGDVVFLPGDRVDYMDVSPKQLVSVAAALIPFLENDDANRALMGSNMQRQAVPLVRSDAPLVGTGMEAIVARDSGAAIAARRAGVVDQIDATRIVVRATEETDAAKPGVDIYRLMKFQRSNQSTCINQKPLVRVGDRVEAGRHHRRRSRRPISAIWRSAGTCWSPSCPGTATTSRTRSCSPSASSRTTFSPRFTSRNSRRWRATPSSVPRKSRATFRTSRKRR